MSSPSRLVLLLRAPDASGEAVSVGCPARRREDGEVRPPCACELFATRLHRLGVVAVHAVATSDVRNLARAGEGDDWSVRGSLEA